MSDSGAGGNASGPAIWLTVFPPDSACHEPPVVAYKLQPRTDQYEQRPEKMLVGIAKQCRVFSRILEKLVKNFEG